MAQAKRTDLLRQRMLMRARRRTEGTATTTEQVGPGRRVTGRTAALLLVELLARAMDFRAVLDVMRTGATLGELPADDPMQDVGARLETEDLVRHIDRTGIGAVEGFDHEFHLNPPSTVRRERRRPAA
eukprot:c11706_g1_i1.p3 GENE.c11706_g1_i1~~c11706_g1_i1.p3  ORF type:complete len:128 (+),score=10.49 c11706_g1_i1:22-405(+)